MKILFAGPSLFGQEFDRTGIEVRHPARQGDVYRAVTEGATAIGLIDGVFGSVASIWHKEILFALSDGVRVIGGASLGALRAAECHEFGMEAVGSIAQDYLSGARREDADVCLAHCPAELDFMPLSEPLVDVEATLAALRETGRINAAELGALLDTARSLYFGDRTVEAMVAGLAASRGAAIGELYSTGRVSLKAVDALQVVERLRGSPDIRAAPPDWTFVRSDPWRHYVEQQSSTA